MNFGNCKESRSFTSALERLELEAEVECRNDTIPVRRTSDAQTEPFDDTDQELLGLNTTDILPCRKTIQHSDILNFQVWLADPSTFKIGKRAINSSEYFRVSRIRRKILLVTGRKIHECGFGNPWNWCAERTNLNHLTTCVQWTRKTRKNNNLSTIYIISDVNFFAIRPAIFTVPQYFKLISYFLLPKCLHWLSLLIIYGSFCNIQSKSFFQLQY